MAWTAGVALFGKGSAFVSNLILGWLLSQEDFGLFGIAMGLTSMVMVLSDGGAVRLLRHPAEFQRLARAVGAISLAIMLTVAALLALAAFPVARLYGDPRLAWMILILAVNLAVSNRAYILRTRLAAELRFRALARVDTVMVAVRNIGIPVCALLGFGPLSFVIPMLVATLIDWFLVARIYPGRLPGEKLDRPTLWAVLHASKWIAFGMLAATLIQNSAPVVIRKFNSTDVVGVYFFGVTVAIAPIMLFTTGLQKVLLPTMTRLAHDVPRQAAAFMKSLRMLALAAGPIGVFAAVTAGPFTQLLWQGKWNDSIPVIQLLTLALTFRIANHVGGALLEARSKWRLRSCLQWLDALTMIAAAAIGGASQDMAIAAACVAAQMTLMGLVVSMVAAAKVLLPKRRALAALLPPQLLAVAAGLCAWFVLEQWLGGWNQVARAGASIVLAGGFLALAFGIFMPHRLREVFALIADRRGVKPVDTASPGVDV